jgi:Ran GTPase-activating protein (RanGAP) involved in mRNA processing and transport
MRVNFTPNIGDEEMKYLCKCLRWNNNITHLDLSSNNITDDGAKLLAGVLKENRQSRLRRINLKQNFIRSDGLAALAESLATNKNIEVLEFGNQFIMNNLTKSVAISSDRYEKLLISLIEDTLERKSELLSDRSFFHNYLMPVEAEEKIRKQNQVGSYLFYIKQSAPGILFVCFSSLDDKKQIQYVHKVIILI